MMASELEEQHEKLRRAVDGWRCRSVELLKNLHGGPCSSTSAAADSRSARSRPVELLVEPLDHSVIQSLIHSDNVDLAKFVMVLSYDCVEISRLCRRTSRRLYRRLLLFGHRSSSQEIPLEGEPQKAVGQSLSLFMDLYETISRITSVLRNLLRQLNSLYSQQDKNSRPYRSSNSISLRSLFTAFAEGMSTLLVLDEILRQNTQIKGHLSQFRRMLSKIKPEIDAFDISVEDLECLEEVVSQVEKLFDAGLFQLMVRGGLHLNDEPQKGSYNKKLIEAFTSCTHKGLVDLLPQLDTWKERPPHRQRVLQHIALFMFSANAFDEAPEKKLGKIVADILLKAPVIYVECGIRFKVLKLIENHCPQLFSSWSTLRGATIDCDLVLKNYLSYLNESHSRDWRTIKDSVSCWLVSFQETIHPAGDFRLHTRQIIQGILLACRVHTLALSMIDLHSMLEVPVRRERFKALCHMLILLKVIANTFCAKRLQLIQCLPHVINLIQAEIEGLLLPAKAHLEATKGDQKSKFNILSFLTHGGKDADSKLADSLSLAILSIHLLQGNGSLKRHQILSVTMDVLQSIGHADVDFTRIKKLMSKLALVTDFQTLVDEHTDCSFLYWRKEMMRDWLNMVYVEDKISWLQYLLDAFCDGIWLLDQGNVGENSQRSFERQLEDDVANEIIQPLCRDIENDLRLHVHSAYLKGSVNVNLTKTGVRNLSWYLQMRPLSLPFKIIDMRTIVESSLNSNFYNHTAMALYDWKVYSEMRQLAELKYGLLLDDSNFHGHGSSVHGLDVAEATKDMLNFSRNYTYDLIKQIFFEKVNNDQQRKVPVVLGVDHVVYAISTHGLSTVGIITERIVTFLSQKIQNLSDLLDDGRMRSLLLKERSWKREKENSKKYPFASAEQLSATMAKLLSKDGNISIIDQLYYTITQIGNGLGLARLLYTGGSRHAHQISMPSSISTDGEVDERNPNFADVNHFSHLLSSVSSELEKIGDLCLDGFSFLIPALTLNLMEIRLQRKEKSTQRERDIGNPPLPDDGFPMGTFFILKVTGAEESFKKLNWFVSASRHLEEALTSLGQPGTEQLQKESRGFSLKLWTNQTPPPVSPEINKEMERLRRCQKEMKLVEYAFTVARTIVS